MVTQNHFVIPTTVLAKFRFPGFPEGVTVTAQDCTGTILETVYIGCPKQALVLARSGDLGDYEKMNLKNRAGPLEVIQSRVV